MEIRDRNNQTYRVEEYRDDLWTFTVWDQENKVAYAYCLDRFPTVRLQDLRVKSREGLKHGLIERLQSLIGFPRLEERIWGKGIGSALLERITERAKQENFQQNLRRDMSIGRPHLPWPTQLVP